MLDVGIKAPDFKLYDQNGQVVSLSDFLGKKVVLYFYPKDDTPGCTKQACSFSDLKEDFAKKNVEILGVSKDTIASHKKFEDKFSLSFTIISDPGLQAIQAYDVWHEKNMYGKKVMGVVRTTYVIDEEGIITHAFGKVDAEKNPHDMLELFS